MSSFFLKSVSSFFDKSANARKSATNLVINQDFETDNAVHDAAMEIIKKVY